MILFEWPYCLAWLGIAGAVFVLLRGLSRRAERRDRGMRFIDFPPQPQRSLVRQQFDWLEADWRRAYDERPYVPLAHPIALGRMAPPPEPPLHRDNDDDISALISGVTLAASAMFASPSSDSGGSDYGSSSSSDSFSGGGGDFGGGGASASFDGGSSE